MKRRHRILRVRGGRVAVTNTSSVDDRKVDRAIRFVAKRIDLNGTIIHVKRAGPWRRSGGRAYPYVPSIANTDGLRSWDWDYLITVTDMCFVRTLAHEARHVEQFRNGERLSERKCHAFAAHMLNLWKAQTAPEGAARQTTS